jgi:iron(III) transport system ATP-binding protein
MSQIEIEGLTKNYLAVGGKSAGVIDFSLVIGSGEFVTLLGPSGCGKTTTLRLIAGLLKPDSGSISVAGRILSSAQGVVPPEARDMGMVFQNYAVWPHKTVFDNVAFGLKIRRGPAARTREQVARALASVNLVGFENRYPNELSGGQQQRVALARSLVVEPKILLLDEPLSNLDAKLRERMRLELKQLQRRTGITFIYVTHDQSEALALSDRIAVMHEGRLQQYGAPREVYRSPNNRVVADFMGTVNLVEALVCEAADGGFVAEAGPLNLALGRSAGVQPGDRVELAIRPESIRLAIDNGGPAGIRARVEEVNYLGNFTEYLVAVGPIRLRVQSGADAPFLAGDEALLSIDANQYNVFPLDKKTG